MAAREQQSQCLTGQVERVVYQSSENQYTVLVLNTQTGQVTATGYFPPLQASENLRLWGSWVHHPKYGRQFSVERFERILPNTPQGVIGYLASGLFRGIGPKTAKRIVDALGPNALSAIQQNPAVLLAIPGISAHRAAVIVQGLEEYKALETIMVSLYDLGLTPNLATKIYRRYGRNSLEIIRQNPYQLTEDLFGVGFKTADRIARAAGIAPDSIYRVRAAILHILRESAEKEGHCYLPHYVLTRTALTLLNEDMEQVVVTEKTIEAAIEDLIANRQVKEEDGSVYLTGLFYAEVGVARYLQRLSKAKLSSLKDPGEVLTEIQKEKNISYTGEQLAAIRQALTSPVTVITGGPGTGKTTIVYGIVHAFKRLNPSGEVLLAAPTGRAAKRLAETTEGDAKTIHRLLGYRPDENGQFRFAYNEDNPLEGDLLVVDEFSMVDVRLAYHLFAAVPPGMRVVIVGDQDQLPPVGPGVVFKDILSSSIVPVIRLEYNFRQAQGSKIAANAHLVRKGQIPPMDPQQGDYFFYKSEDPEKAIEVVKTLARTIKNKRVSLLDFQVLAPMYRGTAGIDALNKILQDIFNPLTSGKPFLAVGERTYRLGDKVMVLKNNYEKDVYNGDQGLITRIILADDDEEGLDRLIVNIEGREVNYTRDELDEITLAYACSVHKAQGSQFKYVIVLALTQYYIMLQRNLLYTAFTRAQDSLVVVGQPKAVAIAVNNKQVQHRYTGLERRLRAA